MSNYLIDMHCHTTASDGSLTPTEIIKLAKESGLKAIAITDHDTTDGIDEALKAGEKYNIEVIKGIEFAALYDTDTELEIHILGYFIDHKNKKFKEVLKSITEARENRNILMVEKLRKIGIDITIEDVNEDAGGEIITRAHFANVLQKKGYVKSKNEAFSYFLSPGKAGYVRREFVTPKVCIDAIKNAGGAAFLAHPTLYKMSYEQIEKALKHLKELGLVGVESEYSTYSTEQERNIKKIAKKLDLLISGGSDFHGSYKPDIKLGVGMGNLKIPYEYAEKIKFSILQHFVSQY